MQRIFPTRQSPAQGEDHDLAPRTQSSVMDSSESEPEEYLLTEDLACDTHLQHDHVGQKYPSQQKIGIAESGPDAKESRWHRSVQVAEVGGSANPF